jgi:glutamate-1-semialdehyde aminotransferase
MPNRVTDNPRDPDIRRSEALWARARGLIPCGTQTLAKGPTQFVDGLAPKYLRRGLGARVWDVDDNEYLDYVMGVGPLVLGYGHPAVDGALRAQLDDGITFSLMHPLEVEVAERVRALVPGAEAVRFAKTGAEATSAAVRLARAFTGREIVASCGYHGWHDWCVGITGRGAGVPAAVRALTRTFRYNDLDSAAAAIDADTACVVLEPVAFEAPRGDFLHALRALCDARGALLIFDEMWTGFRLALGGAQQALGVRADLACFSKAVANGMPLALLTGRADVLAQLEREVFFFSTFGGEALSLAAARATLDALQVHDVPGHLARLGRRLRDGYNDAAAALGLGFTRCVGYPCRTQVLFEDQPQADGLLLKSFVQQELLRRGVLWSGVHNLSLAHTDSDVEYTLGACGAALEALRAALRAGDVRGRLRGAPVLAALRRQDERRPEPAGARA